MRTSELDEMEKSSFLTYSLSFRNLQSYDDSIDCRRELMMAGDPEEGGVTTPTSFMSSDAPLREYDTGVGEYPLLVVFNL